MARFVLLTALICFVCCLSTAKCQFYFYNDDYYDSQVTCELGFSAGGMNCLTDLGGNKGVGKKFMKDINWNATRLCGSVYAAATYHNFIAARIELLLGEVTANDNILKNDRSAAYGRFVRNLSFRTGIAEASLLIEFHPLPVIAYDRLPLLSPYIFTGIALFGFNPQAYYNNTWINLSAMHTEGQGFPEYKDRHAYKLTQLNMPLGWGIKYEVSPVLTLRFEISYRKLWTDYLDDVSKTYVDQAAFDRHLSPSEASLARKLADRRLISDPSYGPAAGDKRGNEKDNDSYFSLSVKTGIVLGRQKRK